MLIKPKALQKGDKVATISLSSGSAGLFPMRYKQGKEQFEQAFQITLEETPHSLCKTDKLYENPQLRLDDLMWAFENPEIKGILTNIGGDDTIRLLRLMTDAHFEIIHKNPKVFMGLSDTTVNHFMCYKAGISSFYSPSLLYGYAENGGIPDIMIKNTQKTLFNTNPIGVLPESHEFIIDRVYWGKEPNADIRVRTQSPSWRYIQGSAPVQGRLIGGCIDVLDFINGTSLWPSLSEFENAILFIETSEDRPSPNQVLYWMRNFGAQGILNKINGILFARPGGEFLPTEQTEKEAYLKQYTDFDKALIKVCKEFDCTDIPIVTHMDFGHTVPQIILPYGALAEINPHKQTVSILESGVI